MSTSFATLPAALSPPLSDREAVADALYRCCLAWDTNDETLFATSFLDDGELNLNGRALQGHEEMNKIGNALIFSLDTTHLVGNVRVNFVEGEGSDQARLTATVMAQHFGLGKGMDLSVGEGDAHPRQSNKHIMSGALYGGNLVKDSSDGLWKFRLLTVKPSWVEGYFSVVGGNFSEQG